MSTPHFERPEQDEYLDWLDSLPECRRCEGTGHVADEFGETEHTCLDCDGSGKVFPDGADNESIDADLVREYGDDHEPS